jgi:hypothetical protein
MKALATTTAMVLGVFLNLQGVQASTAALSGSYILQNNACMAYEAVGSLIIVHANDQIVEYGQAVSVGGFQAFETLGVGHQNLANTDGSYSNGGSEFDYVETEEPSSSNANQGGPILTVKFVRKGNQLTIYRDQGHLQTCELTVSQ